MDITVFIICFSAALADQRASCAGLEGGASRPLKGKPPLLRSRTLPAIIVPGINILQAQIDPQRCQRDGIKGKF